MKFNADRFRVHDTAPAPPKPMPPVGKLFIRCPQWWATTAGRLPGKALAVALALWREGTMRNNAQVRLSTTKLAREWSIKPGAARRGLAALEKAGLVEVDRARGRCPRVTILEKR